MAAFAGTYVTTVVHHVAEVLRSREFSNSRRSKRLMETRQWLLATCFGLQHSSWLLLLLLIVALVLGLLIALLALAVLAGPPVVRRRFVTLLPFLTVLRTLVLLTRQLSGQRNRRPLAVSLNPQINAIYFSNLTWYSQYKLPVDHSEDNFGGACEIACKGAAVAPDSHSVDPVAAADGRACDEVDEPLRSERLKTSCTNQLLRTVGVIFENNKTSCTIEMTPQCVAQVRILHVGMQVLQFRHHTFARVIVAISAILK